MVYEIAETFTIPIIASGGIMGWEDAVEYLMAGAHGIGVCTVGHLQGMRRYPKLIADLETYFREKKVTPEGIRGLAHRKVRERKENGWAAITKPLLPVIAVDACTGCGKCERSCIYGAISVEKAVLIDPALCYGCGLCVATCTEGALALPYYR